MNKATPSFGLAMNQLEDRYLWFTVGFFFYVFFRRLTFFLAQKTIAPEIPQPVANPTVTVQGNPTPVQSVLARIIRSWVGFGFFLRGHLMIFFFLVA